MIETAGAAELLLNSAFSLHLSQRRAPLSCPRAKVWLRRNRHSLADLAMEEGLEMAVDALNAVSRVGGSLLGGPSSSGVVLVLSLAFVAITLGGFLAATRKR
jgi:hypothetical protein